MPSLWNILPYKQLILLKLVDFPLVPRYNGAPWRAFEAIQKSGLMVGMNIFTIRVLLFALESPPQKCYYFSQKYPC
jgi:hypothetical protein